MKTHSLGAYANLSEFALRKLQQVIIPGDTVIDANVGFADYTLFLASLVGQEGSVIGLDSNLYAIKSSAVTLSAAGYMPRVQLLHDDYSYLSHLRNPEWEGMVKALIFSMDNTPHDSVQIELDILRNTLLKALNDAMALVSDDGYVLLFCNQNIAQNSLFYRMLTSWAEFSSKDYEVEFYYNKSEIDEYNSFFIINKKGEKRQDP